MMKNKKSLVNRGRSECVVNQKISIEKLSEDKIDQTVDVLIESFKDEAFTKAWLNLSYKKIRSAYSKASKIKLLLLLESGQPVFIAKDKEKVIGFIALKTPGLNIRGLRIVKEMIGNLPILMTLLPSFIRIVHIGTLAMKTPQDMPAPYYTLEAIAVDPHYQGKKVGSALLEYAHNVCKKDKNARGIYLCTGDEKNKKIYEKFGYRLIEARNTKGFISYHMFLMKSF
jgi:GNAT superfamily N-acetyltransferase